MTSLHRAPHVALCLASICAAAPAMAHDMATAASASGHPPKAKAHAAGAPVRQDLTPVRQIEMYLDGFHAYHTERHLPAARQRQLRVAHYCHHAGLDLVECAIYDGNTKDAHLIGIEYVISDKRFKALPAAEQKYWHPHDGEVDSGMLAAPGIPGPPHTALLGDLRTTHGKTWHVWQVDKDAFPYGDPQLMWSIDPKQINAKTKAAMDARKKSATF